MKISDYNYELPESQIAVRPPTRRGDARLLVLDRATGKIQHRRYADVVDYLHAGDVLVINNTQVIKARLIATNTSGKDIELLVLEKHGTRPVQRALHRGKVRIGEVLVVAGHAISVVAEVDGIVELQSDIDLYELAQASGNVPLPPYLKRLADEADTERYQTVFADTAGSVAAPTASLNMTTELLEAMRAKGVTVVALTLHVGLGTFLPIRSDTVEDHIMHSEYFEIPLQTVQAIRTAKGKVVALGTTVARTLEYAAEQINESNTAITGEANIFIYPGYDFKLVDALLTNFHAPRSTVLMLAAGFASWGNLKSAYHEALHEGYRFLSYGDSMLIV